MNEQIYLGGAPTIGFGSAITDADERGRRALGVLFLSWGVGAIGGGVIGYNKGKLLGAVGGVVVGGIVGTVAGGAVASMIARQPDNVGVGAAPVVASGLPWGEILASSVVSAAAGWAIDETVQAVRKRRR